MNRRKPDQIVKLLRKAKRWPKGANNGDILICAIEDQTYRFMFVVDEGGKTGLWSPDHRDLIEGDTAFFKWMFTSIDSWGLLQDEDHDKHYEQSMASPGSAWGDYTLSEEWDSGERGQIEEERKCDGWAIAMDAASIIVGDLWLCSARSR